MAVKILGTGSYLPSRVVTNDEIAEQLESSAEWIVSHTGIESRHIASSDESAATMGVEAARAALTSAGVDPLDISLIILTTTTPDYVNYPSTACLVQNALGCKNAAAFDLAAACSGFVYGLEMAKSYLLTRPNCKALIIGSEILSRHVDWTNRSNAMLFGDGAGAVVLESVPGDMSSVTRSILGADGSGADVIRHGGGSHKALTDDVIHSAVKTIDAPYLEMDGHPVFSFAVRKLSEMIETLCSDANLDKNDLDMIFAHQANVRILDAVARRVKLPMEKFFMNLKTVGNTSSASIPICLDEAVRSGLIKDDMRFILAGFGSGLTWAGSLVKWPYI